jgi:hypothetical protein
MAKKPIKELEPKKALAYGTPDGLEERERQLDEAMRSFDVSRSVVLPMNWNGTYTFRILPLFDMSDWLVPYGYHWNVFPTGDPKKPASKDGCPRLGYYDPEIEEVRFGQCYVCDAIDRALAEKKAKWDDFSNEKGIMVQKKFYLRILLLEVELEGKKGKPNPPVFDDLPAIKILEVPISAAKVLRQRMADEKRFGFQRLTHPKDGLVICLTRNDELEGAKMYDPAVLPESYEIPEEFLGFDGDSYFQPDTWPNIDIFIPQTSPGEMLAKIEKHQMEINKFVANYTLAIDAESRPVGQRALPPAQGDEAPSGKQSIADMRARMAARKKA